MECCTTWPEERRNPCQECEAQRMMLADERRDYHRAVYDRDEWRQRAEAAEKALAEVRKAAEVRP